MATIISRVLFLLVAAAQLPIGNPQTLAWVDRSGQLLSTIGQPQWTIASIAISPDGTRIAVRGVNNEKDNPHVWVFDVARGTRSLLTTNAANEGQPAWSAKGDRLAFISYRNGLADLYIKPTFGTEQEVQLTTNPNLHDFAPNWSPDGKYIIFHTQDPKTNDRNVMYLSLDRDRNPVPFVQTSRLEALATFSPDGRYVAYQSDETGKWEVYVKSFPPNEARWKVSMNGGVWPKWSGRGDELFFFEGNNLMSVPVQLRPSFRPGETRKLFTGEQVGMGAGAMEGLNATYDVTRDGQKFVVVQRAK